MNKLIIAVFGANEKQMLPELKSLTSEINYYPCTIEKLMEPIEPIPDLILCYTPSEGLQLIEVAQTLRMTYPDGPIFFMTTEKKEFDKKKLIKNGFTQAFLLPWEKSDFLASLKEEAIYSALPELRNYKPVKVIDLVPGSSLDFALKAYLPLNNKLILFSEKGESISEEKIERLTEHAFNTLFVRKDEFESFKKYTLNTLSKYLKPNALSETEKSEKLKYCIRELISDLFIEDSQEHTFAKSQSLLKDVKEIIQHLLLDEVDYSKKIESMLNQETNFYQHLTNVSAYAGMFAIALGYEKPDQMALAGILHDIGKINLPIEFADLKVDQLGPHALEAYKKHPIFTLDVARTKKLPLPDKVMLAIQQHHESMNGSGYPEGLPGHRISIEGKILAIANSFDHLTAMEPNRKAMSLRDALIFLIEENSKDPGRMSLDIDLLLKLKDFFIK
ncbi:MAG: HD-GYP domain-containing protein [Bacteriovoracaceae bacterium]